MRITEITATPVAVPFVEEELWAYGGRRGIVSVLVEVHTDNGLIGIGEAPAYPSAPVVLGVLQSLNGFVIGEDPFRIERIIKRIDVIGTWHHVQATSPAIAGVEMACWDIIGKVCAQPLVNLFGGRVRDLVEYIYYVSQRPPEEVAAHGRRGREAGYLTFYLKVGSDNPRADLARVEALRDGAGPDAKIRVDANEAWSAGTAIRLLGELERYGLEYAEQPVSGRNLSQLAYVRGRVNTPLLANEASWTRYDQLDLIRHEAADAVSVDNQLDGGLLNLKRSAGICEAAALPVVKHSLGELGVATYAAAHVIAATPNFLAANQAYGSLLADDVIIGGALPYREGRLAVPSSPGIGVDLDTDRVAKYAELYTTQGHAFAFGDPAAWEATPVIPKL